MTHNQLALQSNKIESYKAYESMRHNKQSEVLTDWINQETKRHNVATEVEANRHQTQMEGLEKEKNTILNFQATEAQRHNQRIEEIQERGILVDFYKAEEAKRHNVVQEAINQQLANTEAAKAVETVKHNRNTESIQRLQAVSDNVYKSAAAANQREQAKLSTAKTKTEDALRAAKKAGAIINNIQGTEDILLKPFESLSKQFNDYAGGLGSLARGASSVLNFVGGK